MFEWLLKFYQSQGLDFMAETAVVITLLFAVGVVARIAHFLAKRVMLKWLSVIVAKTKNQWDDVLYDRHVFDRLAHVAPAVVILFLAPLAFPAEHFPSLLEVVDRITMAYMFLIGAWFWDALLSAIEEIYRAQKGEKHRPIKGYLQALKVVIFLLVSIVVVSELIGESPRLLLSGLGALTAVLLLIFKDAILGVVAGIQLSVNNMVLPGDWISVPKADADGDVIDISLTTVKVQNWDKTITTIPIYSLISEPFTNWRGMTDSGGRRIKRSIFLDINSIRFCDPKLLEKLAKINLIAPYLKERGDQIHEERQAKGLEDHDVFNGPRLTNVGVFRRYITAYLEHRPDIFNPDEMTFLVRQLAPGIHGLPIEIYVFSRKQAWAVYEGIQADIFDHLLAVATQFDLKIYQQPGGADLQAALMQQRQAIEVAETKANITASGSGEGNAGKGAPGKGEGRESATVTAAESEG